MSQEEYDVKTKIHLPTPIEEVKEEFWYLEYKDFCTQGCVKQFNVRDSKCTVYSIMCCMCDLFHC